MSSFGGGGGSRTARTVSTPVYVNVYDMSPANQYLYPIGLGMHHTGLEINNIEYSFAAGAGIFDSPPQSVPNVVFRERLFLGKWETTLTTGRELPRILDDLAKDEGFGPNDYSLIRKNCNHFTDALCKKLLNGQGIPSHLNRLAAVGDCCSCLLPRELVDGTASGPGSQPTSSQSGGSVSRNMAPTSGFMVRAPPGAGGAAHNKAAFSGQGTRLGSGSSMMESKSASGSLWGATSWSNMMATTSTSGNTPPSSSKSDDLTDRRERARKAALARLEKSQQQQQQM